MNRSDHGNTWPEVWALGSLTGASHDPGRVSDVFHGSSPWLPGFCLLKRRHGLEVSRSGRSAHVLSFDTLLSDGAKRGLGFLHHLLEMKYVCAALESAYWWAQLGLGGGVVVTLEVCCLLGNVSCCELMKRWVAIPAQLLLRASFPPQFELDPLD